jgi:DNA-binding response OmpR family regulator
MVPKKQTILLIEDDEAIREMYELKFAHVGVAITTAADGQEALKLAHRIKPTILLLDIKIPTIGGEEVLEELQQQPWAKQMKVIILSNINEKEAPAKLRELHYDRYMVKAHFTPSKVVKAVTEVIDGTV